MAFKRTGLSLDETTDKIVQFYMKKEKRNRSQMITIMVDAYHREQL